MKTIADPRYRQLALALRRQREKLEMNQTEVGEAIGRDQFYVSRIESGDQRIDVFEFVRICKALKLDWAKLLGKHAD